MSTTSPKFVKHVLSHVTVCRFVCKSCRCSTRSASLFTLRRCKLATRMREKAACLMTVRCDWILNSRGCSGSICWWCLHWIQRKAAAEYAGRAERGRLNQDGQYIFLKLMRAFESATSNVWFSFPSSRCCCGSSWRWWSVDGLHTVHREIPPRSSPLPPATGRCGCGCGCGCGGWTDCQTAATSTVFRRNASQLLFDYQETPGRSNVTAMQRRRSIRARPHRCAAKSKTAAATARGEERGGVGWGQSRAEMGRAPTQLITFAPIRRCRCWWQSSDLRYRHGNCCKNDAWDGALNVCYCRF